MRFRRIFEKAQKIKLKKLIFKVCLAFKLQFLKNEKFNNFENFQKSINIIYSAYMIFFIVFLAKIRVLARISCQK